MRKSASFGHHGRKGYIEGTDRDDVLTGSSRDEIFHGGRGDDEILGKGGRDTALFNVSRDGAGEVDLGAGNDTVKVSAKGETQVRLTFTSSEVGNGDPDDSSTMANQDGGLAVRLQAEDGSDGLTGPVSRYDDEGISFEAKSSGVKFDVRDLVSGAQRGDHFDEVRLGTSGNDVFDEGSSREAYYINAGMGDDRITGGRADDFLVGGAGDDTLSGGRGDDTLLGGAGNDRALFNVSRDGADSIDLGAGSDVIGVSATPPGQIRLTFTSSEVGNGSANDSNTMANQDGGLAVRLQAEDRFDGLVGPVSRLDDEGITFVASSPNVTFDVRDLVAGTQRGDQFEVVVLGTNGADNLTAVQADRPYYFNAGMGDDTVSGGNADDFLVGGAGDDTLSGGSGDDTLLGGAGNDRALFDVSSDGADSIDLGAGSDVISVSATPGQIRLTFTSSEVGNGSANDSNTMANQDGGLAVRLQAEDGSDGLVGLVSRIYDEGITFVASSPNVTFDVRDLVAGTQRGDQFEVVSLGTNGADNLTAVQADRPYYFNAGMGDDTITGGNADDFLVGGAGGDTLNGGLGSDTHIGGAGADTIVFDSALGSGNVDRILDFSAADDAIELDSFVFTGFANGALEAEAFALSSAAPEADDRIIYDQATGDLFFDASGGFRDDMTAFANLFNKPADLSSGDFFIV